MEALSQAPAPVFIVTYNGRDISVDISPFIMSLTYTDNLDGEEADSLELSLEDTDGRWINAWYPDAGATLTAKAGLSGYPLLDCGTFEIDDIEFAGPPSTVSLKAQSAAITKPMRTQRSAGYDDSSLAGIVRAVAARHRLQVVGEIEDIPVRRATQYRETDLGFVRRIAEEYGYAYNVRGKQLVFYRQSELRGVAPVLVIGPGDVSTWQLRDNVKGTPESASVAYHEPKSKKVVAYGLDASGAMVATPSADSIRLKGRTESKAQAKAKCEAALDKASVEGVEGNFKMAGDARVVAGNNVALQGFGRFDGEYQVKAARHTIQRSGGYGVDFDCRRHQLGAAAAKAAQSAQSAGGATAKSKRIAYAANGQAVAIPAGQR